MKEFFGFNFRFPILEEIAFIGKILSLGATKNTRDRKIFIFL